tara:strand:+ start:1239 stop:1907 length:669 start_codon:yes stop_codon:yes gene_type:complete
LLGVHNLNMSSLSSSSLIDIPEESELPVESQAAHDKELSDSDQKAREKDDAQFYERLLNITKTDDVKSVDSADFQFLTDFSIVNVTLTVYRELQANTFFSRTSFNEDQDEVQDQENEDPEKERKRQLLEAFNTRGKFRLCQIYPLIVRAVIGYYSTIASNYYEDTIEQRRYDQVPIGLNDKAYAIVCSAVSRLVELEMINEGINTENNAAEEGEWRNLEQKP